MDSPVAALLGPTRGEILRRACSGPVTVAELASILKMTRNGVRVHLSSMERDGLVQYRPVRRGVGKPAYVYEATEEGRRLFSRAYAPVLAGILRVLRRKLSPEELETALRETGLLLGRDVPSAANGPERLERALDVLRGLGGDVALLPGENGNSVIRGACCPLADVVSEDHGVCRVVESLVESIVGGPVREDCDRTGVPACRFIIGESA